MRFAALLLLLAVARPAFAERLVITNFIAGKGGDETGDLPGGDFRDGVFVLNPTFGAGLDIRKFNTGESRAAIEFSLTGLQRPATIHSATLTFHQTQGTTRPFGLRLDGYVGDGVITPADFATDNLLTNFDVGPGADSVTALDVTCFIQQLASFVNLPPIAGFSIRATAEGDSADSISIVERSDIPELPPPMLVIDYTATVPEPATWLLAAVGGMLLAARARRLH